MLPEKLFEESQTFFKEVKEEKKSFGIAPEKWFPVKRRDFRTPILLNSGIGPENLLLTKLMVRRLRS